MIEMIRSCDMMPRIANLMTPPPRSSPVREQEEYMKSDLVSTFTRIHDQKMMKKFFSEIFTDAERSDLELRWELMKRLHEGVTQREIAAQLGISLCKITRGSKIVKSKTSTTNKILNGKI